MAHASGNPTWEDWPSTATPVTANALEAVEGVVDGLVTRPTCEARLTADYTGLAADTWYTLRGQMAVPTGMDPFGMFQQPTAGANYQIVVPAGWGGRYEVDWTIAGDAVSSPYPTTIGVVLLNCPDTTYGGSAITGYSAFRQHAPGPALNVHGTARLAAGDRLAIALYCVGSAVNLRAVMNGSQRTKVVVRHVGA